MMLKPDDALFHHAYAQGMTYDDFAEKVRVACEDKSSSVAVLRGEVGRIARDVNQLLIPRGRSDFNKQVQLADFLAKQKVTVPIDKRFGTRVSNDGIDQWSVSRALKEWGFEPTRIEVSIRKHVRFKSRECYVVVTFKKK